jgi:hypothetical protein
MSGAIQDVIDTVTEQISGFRPESGEELDTFMRDLGELPRAIADALTKAADSWTDLPIQPGVIDSVREHAQAYNGLGDSADDAYSTHTSEHAMWLADK